MLWTGLPHLRKYLRLILSLVLLGMDCERQLVVLVTVRTIHFMANAILAWTVIFVVASGRSGVVVPRA